MTKISVSEIQKGFVGEVGGIDVTQPIDPQDVAAIKKALERLPVLVFRRRMMTDDQQVEFSKNFGPLATATDYAVAGKRRLRAELSDASNVSKDGKILDRNDHRLVNNLRSRRWHTDGSYKEPPGLYSLLSARAIPAGATGGETQFADMRAAYDALPSDLKAAVKGLTLQHDVMHSRAAVGFPDFTPEERAALPPVRHPLVWEDPATGRKSLYLSLHASHVVELPIHEGLDLLYELTEFATQPQFVYSHHWELGDLVMWNNRVTMHRARRHSPADQPRDLRRTTTMDVTAAA